MSEDPYALFDARYLPPPTLDEDAEGRKGDRGKSRGYWHPPEDPNLHVNEFYCVRHDVVVAPTELYKAAICSMQQEDGRECVWQYHSKRGVMTITEGIIAYIMRSKNAQEPV